MYHSELYQLLKKHYVTFNPHHDTWVLWTKDNKTQEEFFEVTIGTILVQNTNWKNVDKAVENLRSSKIFTFTKILKCDDELLIDLIRPAGFFKQKAEYLKAISKVFIDLPESDINRELLLKTKGIGKETADSILNFCLRRPVPVIGTYTKRLLTRLSGDIKYLSRKYEFIQQEILGTFTDSTAHNLGVYHALIVAHSQNVCSKKNPSCETCFMNASCAYWQSKREDNEIYLMIDGKINPPKK